MRSSQEFPAIAPIGFVTLLAVSLLTSSCTHTIQLNPTVESSPSIAWLPLTVGVYYGGEFRAYKYWTLRAWNGVTHRYVRDTRDEQYVLPVGQASVTLFERVFPLIFERLLVVPSQLSLPADGPKVAAVIEPTIEGFDIDFGSPLVPSWAEITYRFTFRSPQGEVIASWTITGVGKTLGKAREQGQAVDLAMRDAALKFLTLFRGMPEIRVWLRGVGIEGATGIPLWFEVISRRRW